MAILFHGLLSKILDWMGDSPYTVKTTKAPVVLNIAKGTTDPGVDCFDQ